MQVRQGDPAGIAGRSEPIAQGHPEAVDRSQPAIVAIEDTHRVPQFQSDRSRSHSPGDRLQPDQSVQGCEGLGLPGGLVDNAVESQAVGGHGLAADRTLYRAPR